DRAHDEAAHDVLERASRAGAPLLVLDVVNEAHDRLEAAAHEPRDERTEERLFAREILVERPDAHAGGLGDAVHVHRAVVAPLKLAHRGLEDGVHGLPRAALRWDADPSARCGRHVRTLAPVRRAVSHYTASRCGRASSAWALPRCSASSPARAGATK